LLADQHNGYTLQQSHTPYEGGIVAVSPVSVDLSKVFEDPFDIVECVRTPLVSRQLHVVPRGYVP